jgi:chemotaxis protein methyltransferase CheR
MRSLGPLELVFCRNVLIYFDDQTKRNILKEIHSNLFRGGWLLLGGAETVFTLSSASTHRLKKVLWPAPLFNVAR